METEPASSGPRGANEMLADLEADRAALATHVRTPAWYLAGVSALAAAFTAGPLLGDDRTNLLATLGGALLVLAALLQQRRRVRPAKPGGVAWGWTLLLVVTLLLLLSVSFGLVAGGLAGWVALPALAAAVVTYGVLRRLDAQVRRQVARVR
ncbi:hypothetical protein [Cellulomonas iranensis]|uniref:hypothetical protein n=1 Tax=Cellulomonas iranensis TaxID=76862 RepID=UPI001177C6FA|nr:hypothetical protein [Cellulomonas iranensis]